ncbi:MAG: hypothetical protein K9N35_08470 [Candidatus Marinimicrobia bacterium]|nr:hypothetical protein [Candidatus Neomarinimicrobiota bacterium]
MILLNSKQKVAETPYSFQDRFRDIQRIAIIYPEKQQWLRIARYTLQRLYNLPERFHFLIMRPPGTDIRFRSTNFQYGDMLYAPVDEERSALHSRFMEFDPNMLLQLEPQPDARLIRLLESLPIGLKIGFGPEDSGLNIVYMQNKTSFYEKNLLNLIALIET